jgi:5'-phosphate synthase pdxT subunit
MVRLSVGVLALQGNFDRHAGVISGLGHESRLVRTKDELDDIDALVLPGGESTTLQKLLDDFGLRDPLRSLYERKLPIMGTCAGLILVSREVTGRPEIRPLGFLDVTVERNAYGRQRESFEARIQVRHGENPDDRLGVFIRAPRIVRTGESVEVLATYRDEPVMVRQDHALGLTFHPELTDDPSFHQYFLDMATR